MAWRGYTDFTARAGRDIETRVSRFPTPSILVRQFAAFFGVGIAAAIVHYGLLIALVEGIAAEPVPATLLGYVAGGLVSYALNRRHTYESTRPHREATWRFALVAFVGFLLTWGFMHAFVGVDGRALSAGAACDHRHRDAVELCGAQGVDVCVSLGA